jgi:hypothetical protein
LDLGERAEVVVGNTFVWWQRQGKPQGTTLPLDDAPWAVFCSPPYDFYVERTAEMLDLIAGLIRVAPDESVFVVEADARFDVEQLPNSQAWDVRSYPPAVVGIFFKERAIAGS